MSDQAWVPVQVVGVRAGDDETVVLLLDGVDGILIPIAVGRPEAAAIAAARAGVTPPRPMTHDLLVSVVRAWGTTLVRAEIARLEHGIFHADLVFSDGTRIDSRASDAIAVALRLEAPVLCAQLVVEEAGVAVQVSPSEDDMVRFRDFLDQVSADDFDDVAGPDEPER
jgi:uncharacterized protein